MDMDKEEHEEENEDCMDYDAEYDDEYQKFKGINADLSLGQ